MVEAEITRMDVGRVILIPGITLVDNLNLSFFKKKFECSFKKKNLLGVEDSSSSPKKKGGGGLHALLLSSFPCLRKQRR